MIQIVKETEEYLHKKAIEKLTEIIETGDLDEADELRNDLHRWFRKFNMSPEMLDKYDGDSYIMIAEARFEKMFEERQ